MPLPAPLDAYATNSPAWVNGSRLTPLIDGDAYFQALADAFSTVGTGANQTSDEFILISGFWLCFSGDTSKTPPIPPFKLPTANDRLIIEILQEKAANGVDVRVMGWIHYSLLRDSVFDGPMPFLGPIPIPLGPFEDRIPTTRMNRTTAVAVQTLRGGTVGAKAILNPMNHPVGGVHAKLVVVGKKSSQPGFHEMTAFTGGIDLVDNRRSAPTHVGRTNFWHDCAVKIQGSGAQGVYDTFQDMWQGCLGINPVTFNLSGVTIDHYLPTTPELLLRIAAPVTATTQWAQSVRTLPARRHALIVGGSLGFGFNPLPSPVPWNWDSHGVFDIGTALEKAISAATQYIYIEDQYHWSPDVYEWLSTALRDSGRPNLRVLLLTGAHQDPDDADDSRKIRIEQIRTHLLPLLGGAERERFRLVYRWGDLVEPFEPNADFGITSVTMVNSNTDLVRTNVPSPQAFDTDAFLKRRWEFHQGSEKRVVSGNPAIGEGALMAFHVDSSGGSLATGIATLKETIPMVVHSKVVIIDDRWAMIGSANMARRGLLTDAEHSVAFADEAATGGAVQAFRQELWGHHFHQGCPEDIEQALHLWDSSWFPLAGPGRPKRDSAGPDFLESTSFVGVTPPSIPLSPRYDTLTDPDSREYWPP